MKHVLLFVLLVLCIISLKAQEYKPIDIQQEKTKWYKITKNDIIIMSLQVISGAADGVNQAVIHHKFGKGDRFWDIKTSWTNKLDWPNRDPKFFGSTTIFVMFTDGFHLTRFVDRTATFVTIGISFSDFKNYDKKDIWKVVAKKAVLSLIANKLTFVLVYNNLHGNPNVEHYKLPN